MKMLDAARKYVNQFKWSVIPVKKGGKMPAIHEVTPFRTRYATDDELVRWFSGDNQMAVITGKLSNLSIVDIDGPTVIKVSSPVRSLTPKGQHHYFKFNERVKNHVRLFNNLDTRSEGGYCLVSPSDGYRWSNSYFSPASLPDFPSYLLSSADDKAQPNGIGWLADALTQLTQGNRNATFAKIVGRLHRDAYSSADIMAFLSPHANRVDFPTVELETIIESISKYKNTPNLDTEDLDEFLIDLTPIEWIAPGLLAKGSLAFVAGLPETNKTWLLMDLAIEVARGGGQWLGKFNVNPGKVLFIDQERFKSETQRRFKGLIGEKALDRKQLKGQLFIKCGTTTRLDLDDSFRAFHSELNKLRPDLVIVDSWATFMTCDENDRMTVQRVIERVKELRNEFGTTFVFIDHETKSVFTDKENNEAPSAYRMVGSVGKVAASEMILTVRRYANNVMVYQTKNSLAPSIQSFNLSVIDTPNGIKVTSHD